MNRSVTLALVLLGALGACTPDADTRPQRLPIGAACVLSSDCGNAPFVCLGAGGDAGSGVCTAPCKRDLDCPLHNVCTASLCVPMGTDDVGVTDDAGATDDTAATDDAGAIADGPRTASDTASSDGAPRGSDDAAPVDASRPDR